MSNSNESYEYNLKLYNESIRKDLDITLSSIPAQKNLMKTILWLNSSIIGLCLTALSKDIGLIYISMPFIFSFLGIITILYSLKDGRTKTLGSPSIEFIQNIKPDEYEKVNGLITMNESFEKALNNNIELIEKRAQKIAFSTNMTIISMISIFIISVLYVNINLMKGG
ncbi:hypothetical protein [Aliarcobacter cryaerophilus]|uniref:Uncharacterized protein n=2 Tax=unclassified Arcobacter TaxID=2593671 RepID=A0AA96D567_9BACT|nr:hypothetical protein RJG52_07420 [Arcobacter sp. AZ-2023]WPD10372.1 hypothetical protein QUR77_03160 [Arcobacter sp. DSM 115954]WNL15202.1 hypothetical protein RJG51_03170 [Arcobacter sp. AZ-2023]WNL18916.1 hypothetical protein RJG53_10070 [Arcobacter sp. AZ-2023]WNL21055.1 hypothetical protein RJG56_09950 [Arcobacter sp. AZ-2023]